MKIEVTKFVNYIATRLMDSFIAGKLKIELGTQFLIDDIIKDMANNETKKILLQNKTEASECLDEIIWTRVEYLMSEGFLVCEDGNIRMKTEAEIEEFINS